MPREAVLSEVLARCMLHAIVHLGSRACQDAALCCPASHTHTPVRTINWTLRAGVVVKHMVDGSSGLLSPGQSPSSAAYEAHMAFAAFLASHSLSVDVWDGDSLLQVRPCVLRSRGRLSCGWAHGLCLLRLERPCWGLGKVLLTCTKLKGYQPLMDAGLN